MHRALMLRHLFTMVMAVLLVGSACTIAGADAVQIPLEPFSAFGFYGTEFVVAIDPQTTYAGHPSLTIRANSPSATAFGADGWAIAVDWYRGKRVRLTAFVKTANVRGASLWLRIDGPKMMFDNMFPDRALSGTHDWTKLSVVLDVPVDATGIVAGGLLEGQQGAMWVAAPQLETVDTSVSTTGGVLTPQQEVPAVPHQLDIVAREDVVTALRRAATPLTTLDPDAPLIDLGAFERAVGDARIVGLGEATHGTSEFFLMKDRLLRDLVEKKGFTVFAIEANQPEAREMDRYVTTGSGDPAHALASMYFWTWRTPEVLALVQWMRAYNAAPGPHATLHFAGFDMQAANVAVASVTEFARARDPVSAKAIEAAYACLPAPGISRGLSPSAWQGCMGSIRQASALLQKLSPDKDTAHDARIIEQYAAMNAGSVYTERDRSMAENVEWLASTAYPGAKIVLWAHNGHICDSHSPYGSMGSHLNARYGRGYYRLGFAFAKGSVRAMLPGKGLRIQSVAPATHGALEDVFSDAGSRFFVNLDTLPKSPLRDWLDGGTLEREIGSTYDPETDGASYLVGDVRTRFDGLIFIAQSNATQAL